MEQIIPGLYYFTGLMVGRVYCIEDADGLTLIDASIPPAADRIIKQLIAAGRSPQEVKRILITHGHPDHCGGLPRLQQLTGAQVYASAIEKPYIQGEEPLVRAPGPIRPPNTTLKGTKVDVTVEDGEVLPVFGQLVALHTPGHSPGHVAYWQPEKKVLFTGDVLFNMPRLSQPWAPMTADAETNRKSIKRLAELDSMVVCFGHGNPIMPNGGEVLKKFVRDRGIL